MSSRVRRKTNSNLEPLVFKSQHDLLTNIVAFSIIGAFFWLVSFIWTRLKKSIWPDSKTSLAGPDTAVEQANNTVRNTIDTSPKPTFVLSISKDQYATILMLLGVAVFFYGLLNFAPSGSGPVFDPQMPPGIPTGERSSWGPSYGLEARIEVAIGAALIIGGALLHRRK
jgi:hypothetical protein